MMPAFKSDKPGKSPMGMDMVPVYEGEEPSGAEPGVVTVEPGLVNRLGVRTATVERTTVDAVCRPARTPWARSTDTSEFAARAVRARTADRHRRTVDEC
jgi:hypothetical protein